MSDGYQPASRRPIAGIFRKTADTALGICLRYHVHPDAISYASLVASAAAGVCFWRSSRWPLLLLIGPLLCYLRLWLNMFDGMVALASGKASPRGEIINELPDRISDVLIFAGVAQSGLCSPISGYWAAILALLTAYVGVLGQAAGARREYGGIMSKPWRMVALHLGAWLTFYVICRGAAIRWGTPTILDWACLIVIVGCVQTVGIRLKRILAALPAVQSRP